MRFALAAEKSYFRKQYFIRNHAGSRPLIMIRGGMVYKGSRSQSGIRVDNRRALNDHQQRSFQSECIYGVLGVTALEYNSEAKKRKTFKF